MNLKKHVDEWLVVHVSDVIAGHAFTFVLLQLHAEDVLVEEALQPLIGNVDAQLLKAVVLKVLKAINVENADGRIYLPAMSQQNTIQITKKLGTDHQLTPSSYQLGYTLITKQQLNNKQRNDAK